MRELLAPIILVIAATLAISYAFYNSAINYNNTKHEYVPLGYHLEDNLYVKYEDISVDTDVKIINSKDTIIGLLNGKISGNIFDIKGNINGNIKENNIIDVLYLKKDKTWSKVRINFEDISFKVDNNIKIPILKCIYTHKLTGPYEDGSNGNRTNQDTVVKTKYVLSLPELDVNYKQTDNDKILK